MGFLDEIGSLVNTGGEGGDHAKVAGGLMNALQEHPGGLQGVIDSLKQNGMDQHVNAWTSGETQAATPQQVQQGLGGTGLIESTAEKAGVSPQVAAMVMSTVLPLVLRHFASNGQAGAQGTEQGALGGVAQQILGRFL